MIDLHFHILPGIDDGPQTITDALELGRAASAAGTRVVVATSHISPRYPNNAAVIAQGVDLVNAGLAAEGIELEVRAGGELAVVMIDDLDPDELGALRLGGGPWLLVESPFTLLVERLPDLIERLQLAGHRVVLAHPERCPGFHRRPELLSSMVADQGVVTSVTAGALIGRFGAEVERFALSMARAGLIHNVASDAHDCERRPPGIGGPLELAGLGRHLKLLTQTMPAAILSGGPLPDHPGPLLDRAPPTVWRRLRPRREPFA